MKLSLVVSSLLVGTSLMFSGCGSDDVTAVLADLNASGTEIIQDLVDEATKALSAEMIAGKTVYVYGYSNDGTSGDAQVKLVFADDGKTCDVFEVENNNLELDDATVAIDSTNISLKNADETLVTWSMVDANTDGIYVYFKSIPDNKTDPYPAVLSFEKLADDGKVLLETFANDTVVTKDKLIAASPQYVIGIEGGNTAECKEIMTFDSAGAVTFKSLDESGTAQYTTTDNNNIISFVDGAQQFEDIILSLTDDLMITTWMDNGSTANNVAHKYTNKQDAIDFAMSYGVDCLDTFTQLEQP